MIVGVSLLPLLNVQLTPSRSLPGLSVYYSWPDASARVIEQEVTSKLEGLLIRMKLRVSRRTVFRYFDEMRLKGAEIGYSKSKESYYLNNNFSFTEDFLQSAMKWHS
jgi:hypothetical protein